MGRQINLRHKQSRIKSLVITLIVIFIIIPSLFLYGIYWYFAHDLPNLTKITGYQPRLTTEVYSFDGRLIGEFGLERRKLISYEEIPPYVRNAFIAVEDKRFFEHKGVDLKRIIGALIKNIEEAEIVQGGSTITQQVAKNLILSPERSISRKIKEAILAYRMEKNLSKEEILYIYLNHIYLGDGTYGIEAASQNYFGKSARSINLSEAALLAALPRAPEYYSPRKHLIGAKSRQELVLELMQEEGFITKEQREQAEKYQIKIVPKRNINLEVAPYFVELVRQYMENKFGTNALRNGGYTVFTTLDVDLSLAAQWALRRGILEFEARQGRQIVIKHLNKQEEIDRFRELQKISDIEMGKSYQGVIINATKDILPFDGACSEPCRAAGSGVAIKEGRFQGTAGSGVAIKEGGFQGTAQDRPDVFTATVGIGKSQGELKFAVSALLGAAVENLYFPLSKGYAPLDGYSGISLVPFEPKVGDVINVKVINEKNGIYYLSIDFMPESQGALLAMDTNGYIKAIVGGFDFLDTKFNRATQAHRQPGSSFKPIVYAAAIDKGYTETTIVYDTPVRLKDWAPENYDGNFLGAIPLREALVKSRNLASVGVLMDIGSKYVARYAKQFGFTSHLHPYPSLALGGSDVTLIEMVNAFNVFASGGKLVQPKFILHIYDRDGKLVEDNATGQYLLKEDAERADREKKRMEIIKEIAMRKGKDIEGTETEFIKENVLTQNDSITNKNSVFLTSQEFLNLVQKNGSIRFDLSDIGEQVISPETAYIVTDMLQGVIKGGTAQRARSLTSLAPLAGKTGTTNNFTDAWFIGFSPKIVAGVWVGKDNHKPLGKGEVGGKLALPIWMDFMKEALAKFPGGDFKAPDDIEFVSTPYGFIPYKAGSIPARVNIENVDGNYNYEGNTPGVREPLWQGLGQAQTSTSPVETSNDESEIDFLMRR